MTMTDNPTVLRLLNNAKEQKDAEDAKAAAYVKRAKGKSDFYHKARINAKLVDKLVEALKLSAITGDSGEALMPWSDEMIQEIVDSIVDDGPKNKNRDMKS